AWSQAEQIMRGRPSSCSPSSRGAARSRTPCSTAWIGALDGARGLARRRRGVRTQLLEARLRAIEVLDLEQFRCDRPPALVQADLCPDALEPPALGQGAERVADGDEAMLARGDVVEGLDDRIGRLLEQRGEPGDVGVSTLEPARSGAA